MSSSYSLATEAVFPHNFRGPLQSGWFGFVVVKQVSSKQDKVHILIPTYFQNLFERDKAVILCGLQKKLLQLILHPPSNDLTFTHLLQDCYRSIRDGYRKPVGF